MHLEKLTRIKHIRFKGTKMKTLYQKAIGYLESTGYVLVDFGVYKKKTGKTVFQPQVLSMANGEVIALTFYSDEVAYETRQINVSDLATFTSIISLLDDVQGFIYDLVVDTAMEQLFTELTNEDYDRNY